MNLGNSINNGHSFRIQNDQLFVPNNSDNSRVSDYLAHCPHWQLDCAHQHESVCYAGPVYLQQVLLQLNSSACAFYDNEYFRRDTRHFDYARCDVSLIETELVR